MKRCWFVLSLMCALASPAAAARDTLPVTIRDFVGLPADSLDRREFLEAFRATMDGDLPYENRAGGTWSVSGPQMNSFRLLEAAPPDAAWVLDITLGLPPQVRVTRPRPKGSKVTPRPRVSGLRASRGLTIVVAASSPSAVAQGAEPTPVRFAVYFADARRTLVPTERLPGGGYDFPWADAGGVVARAALEALHRANGEMKDDERADLAPATRAEEETP